MYFMQIVDLIANDNSIPMSIKLDVSKRIINYCEAGGWHMEVPKLGV